MKYSKREILKAGELGEINMIDVKHLVSLLDEAHTLLNMTNRPHHLTVQVIESYQTWYVKQTGIKPKILVQDGTSAKSIATYLSNVVREKNPTASDIQIIGAWELILENFNRWDKFFQKQISLCQIGKNLNNIIANIRNGQQQSTENRSTSLINLARERFGEI